MISLSALPPYLTYIPTGQEKDSLQRPDLNEELINSSCIYGGWKDFVSAHQLIMPQSQ